MHFQSIRVIGPALWYLLVAISVHGQEVPAKRYPVVVIAHRGNHVKVPENTLAACKEAIRVGADYVEVDLRTTKDGKMVLLHDATVNRTTDGQGPLSDLTWKEVKHLHLKTTDSKKYSIPEFKRILKLCKGKINVYLDFKEADIGQTWKLIQQANMENQVIVYLNKEEQYQQWKNTAPNLPLMTSLPEKYLTNHDLETFLKKVNVQVLDNLKTPERVEEARKHGVDVWLDVQSPTEGPISWNAALQKGVSGMQTDHPEALIRYLKQRNLH
ncbi:glycerophosphodiester phosphodiesterase family protein [Salmonirosea aquatica]|uniref:Glycerophosphodiester phosphodiesterase n=1 Tax=Salmonirosea aquatica TaxID=2654236 RepID=A0A7C9BFI2_9BACT|nr:glycerophosphodiester phosphodiesterase [Cytophagaceae bacterium SJW1-29]